jgi:hypothetical protein
MTRDNEPGSDSARTTWIAGSICAALFAFAFVAAPKSCEWGLTAYFWSGVAALVVLFAIPMALRTDRTGLQRAAFGLAFAAFGAAVWIAGLFAANVRIMCRLF